MKSWTRCRMVYRIKTMMLCLWMHLRAYFIKAYFSSLPYTAFHWQVQKELNVGFCQNAFLVAVSQTPPSEKLPQDQCYFERSQQSLPKSSPLLSLYLVKKFISFNLFRIFASFSTTSSNELSPSLSTHRAKGTCPFNASSWPTTAQSATAWWNRIHWGTENKTKPDK